MFQASHQKGAPSTRSSRQRTFPVGSDPRNAKVSQAARVDFSKSDGAYLAVTLTDAMTETASPDGNTNAETTSTFDITLRFSQPSACEIPASASHHIRHHRMPAARRRADRWTTQVSLTPATHPSSEGREG